jgi:hypothetical protein
MAIRSRTSIALLSDTAWPGLKAWLISVACSIGIFSVLASFAWHGSNSRLSDMTTLLVAFPAGALSVVLVAAAIWTLLARIPFTAGLAFVARVLPIACAIPLFELIRTAGRGVLTTMSPYDGPGYLLASFTGSLLPFDAMVPMGMRVGIFLAALCAAFVVWFATQKLIRTLVAFVVMSIAFVKFTFLPTGLAAWGSLVRGGGWFSAPADAARETLHAVTNGYWWTNLYDRFPTAVEEQAEIAIRLTSAGLVALGLGMVLVLLFFWRVPRARALASHAFRARSAIDLVLYVFGAAILTDIIAQVPAPQGTWWFAVLLGVIAVAAFRIHSVLERCLHHQTNGYATDQANPRDPLACGDVSPDVARDVSLIALLFALLAAFALGWPVFVALLASLAASWLSRDRLWSSWPSVATAFRAAGASALALCGYFFMSQQARLTNVAILVMLLAAAHRVGMEFFFKKKRV